MGCSLNSFWENQNSSNTVTQVEQPLQYKEWYEGGTLHNANAIEWQQASYENKLATCADFIAKLWKDEMLKSQIQSQIQSMDDIKVLAQELVSQMDAAMIKQNNSQQNNEIYTNQSVSDIAVSLVILMGWIE